MELLQQTMQARRLAAGEMGASRVPRQRQYEGPDMAGTVRLAPVRHLNDLLHPSFHLQKDGAPKPVSHTRDAEDNTQCS